MPSYESVLDLLKKNNFNQINENNNFTKDTNNQSRITNEDDQLSKISKDQIKNTIQTKPVLSSLNQENLGEVKISSFEDLINLCSKKKEIHLKYDLEKNVNLIKFSKGKIDISFNQNLDKNFVKNLSSKLFEWTKTRWVITLSKEKGQKTFLELKSMKKKELFDKEKNSEIYKKFKDIFSDVELLEVKKND
jgi:DNA polymerase-3 subunit gamma/tau